MELFKVWSVPKASLPPAILLGGLVLFTYSTLQNYGPESTLRKFHTAIHNISDAQARGKRPVKEDWDLLASTLSEDLGAWNPNLVIVNPRINILVSQVNEEFRSGRTYSLARMDRRPREVRIAVLYSKSPFPTHTGVWVIEKPLGGREWKISAQKTVSASSAP